MQANKDDCVLLQGVPRVGFYPDMRKTGRCPEDLTFASCVRACLEYLGEEVGCRHCGQPATNWGVDCAYAFVLGVSGIASSLSWRPGWDLNNADVVYISDEPLAPYRHTFDALGYDWEFLDKDQKTRFHQAIVSSIREKRRPVLAAGVVGPPECAIITGFDQDGEAVMGWSFFQGDPDFGGRHTIEPTGEFRTENWIDNTEWLILWGEKRERPPLKETFRQALEWALQVSRTPMVWSHGDPRYNGHAAYSAWDNQVALGDGLDSQDLATLRESYFVHDWSVGFLAEARWYGSIFLARAAEHLDPVAEPLLKAAACYAAEHRLMWKVWGVLGGPGPASKEALARFAEPGCRAEIASLLYEAQAQDVKACTWIEKALAG